ncbi:unnamed protein product [Blepharisma stoltei]|uniref:Uncharacterized protein n=1 Tax=Blepharisma stoltei TaxID=1481888 RepID=A0AAU9IZE7_9CILI|nr:unnamed protein product [Blepharisma stoltei]
MVKWVYDGERLGDGEMQMVSWRCAGEIDEDSWSQSGITEHVLQFVSLWGNEFFWKFYQNSNFTSESVTFYFIRI